MIRQACELPKATDAAKIEKIKKLSGTTHTHLCTCMYTRHALMSLYRPLDPCFHSRTHTHRHHRCVRLLSPSGDAEKVRRRATKDYRKDKKSSRRDWRD